MDEKLLTSEIFKNKKDSYPASVPVSFKTDRLTENDIYKSIPKLKQDLFNTKKYLLDQNEKILVIILIYFFNSQFKI